MLTITAVVAIAWLATGIGWGVYVSRKGRGPQPLPDEHTLISLGAIVLFPCAVFALLFMLCSWPLLLLPEHKRYSTFGTGIWLLYPAVIAGASVGLGEWIWSSLTLGLAVLILSRGFRWPVPGR